MNEMVLGIVQEVYSKSIGTISISIIFTIWTAGRGLFALTKGLQSVYHVSSEENESYIYLRIKAIVETIIFIILIVYTYEKVNDYCNSSHCINCHLGNNLL